MNDVRQQLHQLLDSLPDSSLEHAKIALTYCANPGEYRMSIEEAKRHIEERSKQNLREHEKRTGQGSISAVGSSSGTISPTGNYHSSMVVFEDGKDATVHYYVYRGTHFEIIETMQISADGRWLIREEKVTANDGSQQILTAKLPTTSPATGN